MSACHNIVTNFMNFNIAIVLLSVLAPDVVPLLVIGTLIIW